MLVGILGAGQLGRMIALAGYRLGINFRFFDPAADACAGQVGDLEVGAFTDLAAVERFARSVDVVTYEFENVPVATARVCEQVKRLAPGVEALQASQHRLREKEFFVSCGIPVPRFAAVRSSADIATLSQQFSFPIVLKTTTLGYDGKGQMVVNSEKEALSAWEILGARELIAEEFIPFEHEFSIIGVRSSNGELRTYPLAKNVHKQGILRQSFVPACTADTELSAQAVRYITSLMHRLNYVGVCALELFYVHGKLLANEFAPRVHNSGHWSIDGAVTSQFENHVRACVGLSLGDTSYISPSLMYNLIGSPPSSERLASLQGAHIHLYGKEPRPGRKVGHVNFCAQNVQILEAQAAELERMIVG